MRCPPWRWLLPWLLGAAAALGGADPAAMATPQPVWADGTPELLRQALLLRQGRSSGDALVALARQAIGRPYRAFSLDRGPTERLQLDLGRFDCFLFVEQLLALVQLNSQAPSGAGQGFAEQVRRLRYAGGQVDYCHRHHYFSRWAAAAQRQGLLRDITVNLPGAVHRRIPLRFMSTHPEAYAPLRQSANRRCISQLEEGLTLDQVYVPVAAVSQAIPRLRNGDIFGLVTRVKGLDVTHVGIVEVEGTHRHALHAAPGRGVMRSRNLVRYAAEVSDVLGIVVLRPTP